jgi:tape measure domain-containing protein
LALELERLVVSLEASIVRFERAMQRANGVSNATAKKIEGRFAKMNSVLGAQFGALGRSLIAPLTGAAGLRGFQQLLDTNTRIENSLKVAGLAGDQLAGVYDRLFQSAQRNAAPLEALVELYSRASLVQKELGISSEQLERFTDNVAVALRVAGTDAQSASGALLQLAQALGSGTVRAEEFNSIQEGALPVLQAVAAGLTEAGGSVAQLRQLVIDGKVSSEAFFKAFEAGAGLLQEKVAGSSLTASQSFEKLNNVLVVASGQIDEATGVSAGLAEAIGGLAIRVAQAGEAFEREQQPIREFITLVSQALDLLRFVPAISPTGPADNVFRKVREFYGGLFDGTFDSLGDGDPALQAALDEYAAGRRPKSSTVSINQYPTTGDGTGKTRAAKVGEDAKIAAAALEEMNQRQEEARQNVEAFGDAASSVLNSFISDLRGGASAAEALTNALNSVADQLISMAVNQLIQSALGGLFGAPALGLGGGGIGRQTYGGTGGFFPAFPGRAAGGMVQAGRGYRINERTANSEIFVPAQDGYVLPRMQPRGARGTAGPGSVTNVFQIDAKGAEIGVEQKIVRAIQAVVPGMIKSQAPVAVAAAQRNRSV